MRRQADLYLDDSHEERHANMLVLAGIFEETLGHAISMMIQIGLTCCKHHALARTCIHCIIIIIPLVNTHPWQIMPLHRKSLVVVVVVSLMVTSEIKRTMQRSPLGHLIASFPIASCYPMTMAAQCKQQSQTHSQTCTIVNANDVTKHST